jgi:hypothetical protein
MASVTTDARLVTAVSEIASAVSPRARWVNSPELTPLGHAANTIKPTAITGSSPLNCTTANPARGTSST